MTPSLGPAVVVMVKAPVPGTVKTRLRPFLSEVEAARLAAAFFQDAAAGIRQAGKALIVAYAPADGRAALEELLPEGVPLEEVRWHAQSGQSLGERMDAALADAEAQGFGPLIVIGTDSPTLPAAFLERAVSWLQEGSVDKNSVDRSAVDVVFGPTEDGGYYLVGVRKRIPGLFDRVAWSTEKALAQTAANAERQGHRIALLPPWYDIDTPDDLSRLRREIAADPQQARRSPATAAFLRDCPAF